VKKGGREGEVKGNRFPAPKSSIASAYVQQITSRAKEVRRKKEEEGRKEGREKERKKRERKSILAPFQLQSHAYYLP
jgi:hypothetical protein